MSKISEDDIALDEGRDSSEVMDVVAELTAEALPLADASDDDESPCPLDGMPLTAQGRGSVGDSLGSTGAAVLFASTLAHLPLSP